MKRIVLLLSLSIAISITSAQETKVILGIEAAGMRSYPWGREISQGIDPLYSISPGINLEYILSQRFSLKSGAIFLRKGNGSDFIITDEYGSPLVTGAAVSHFDYLTLPVLVSYSTRGKVKFYLSSGPFIGFLLNSKITSGASLTNLDGTYDLSDQTKKLDFGLSFACGIVIPTGNRLAIDIGLKDNLGLIDVFELLNDIGSRLNMFGLVAGIKYRL